MIAMLGVAACSGGGNGPTRRVSADGKTQGIATDGAEHVAYLLDATAGVRLDRASCTSPAADGKDIKVASGVAVGGYLLVAARQGHAPDPGQYAATTRR